MGRRSGDAQGDGRGVTGKRIDTNLAHGGRRKEWRGRIVNPPVHRGSTILFDSIAELRAAAPGHGSHYYGLHGTPTHWALAEALTEQPFEQVAAGEPRRAGNAAHAIPARRLHGSGPTASRFQ